MIRILILIFFNVLLSTTTFWQQVKPVIFGNHMILQRDKAVSIWGTSAPKENITIAFAGQSKPIKPF